MTDLATVTAVLANIKTAMDIAKALKDADLSIERAEMKFKLAEMMTALADAKMEVVEIQQLLDEKDLALVELKEAFQSKDALVKHRDVYYEVDKAGRPIGEPICAHCWQVKHKKYGLQYEAKDRFVKCCVACGRKYEARMAPVVQPNAADA
ncbi:hypothetical protein MO327_00205 [Xanthomonas translucens]|uniref:hypothetical protein n=1 Tax=Xanthomonas campestris pv. translucens TaxID=343 RepID=UPI00272D6FEF|nr:hypothetical protein [Xanthomonas translucens]WLA12400.1 hypothetical protein MO327_00205 [Xanthomonas translucens]